MKSRFYQNGLTFECTACGQCCSNPDGYVQLTEEEGHQLAELLKIPYQQFLDRYTITTEDEGLCLDSTPTGDCVFLQEARCTVYQARPLQCRTYPFWPENLKSPYRWKLTAQECPGIGQGRIVPAEEIIATMNKHRRVRTSRKDQ